MDSSFRLELLLIVIGSSALLLVVDGECGFKAIFNFGDSNSDTGGFWAAFPAQPPPFGMTYFHKPTGRASDGRLVIDFLAQALGLPFLSPYLQSVGSDFRHGANFATLASTVLLPNTSLFVTGISPFSLAIQLNQLKDLNLRASSQTSHGRLPPPATFSRALYTIDIGQNDFTSNLASIGIDGVNQYIPLVANQIANTIKEIYRSVGGRAFMVFNMAPIGCYPAFLVQLPHHSSDVDEYGCMVSYNNAVVQYNAMLKEKLAKAGEQLPGATIAYVDTHAVKLKLFKHPRQHGLRFGTKACCGHGGGVYNFDPQLYCGNHREVMGMKTVTAAACDDPWEYVSWDGIHATEAANKLVALAIINGTATSSAPSFPLSKACKFNPIS